MSKASRDKGNKGNRLAIALLRSRDFDCGDLSEGVSTEDIVAIDSSGVIWCVEVKNTVSINVRGFVKQAREQAARRRNGRWMLMARIDGFASAWLVIRQGMQPTIWAIAEDGAGK